MPQLSPRMAAVRPSALVPCVDDVHGGCGVAICCLRAQLPHLESGGGEWGWRWQQLRTRLTPILVPIPIPMLMRAFPCATNPPMPMHVGTMPRLRAGGACPGLSTKTLMTMHASDSRSSVSYTSVAGAWPPRSHPPRTRSSTASSLGALLSDIVPGVFAHRRRQR